MVTLEVAAARAYAFGAADAVGAWQLVVLHHHAHDNRLLAKPA